MDKLALYELLKRIIIETASAWGWGCPSTWGLTDDPSCLESWEVQCEDCWQRAIAEAEVEAEKEESKAV